MIKGAAKLVFAAFALVLVLPPNIACAAGESPGLSGSPPLRRGMNLAKWLDRPTTLGDDRRYETLVPQDSRTISSADLSTLHDMGVDFVRLPVDPGPALSPSEPAMRDAWFKMVLDATRQARRAGLTVIVTIQPEDYTARYPMQQVILGEELRPKYDSLLAQLTSELSKLGGGVLLEPVNEPSVDCGNKNLAWDSIQKQIVSQIRAVSATLPIVVTSGCYDSIPHLRGIETFDDPNIIYTVHYYDPLIFTLQTAKVRDRATRYSSQVRYPASPAALKGTLAASRDELDAKHDLSSADRDEIFDKAVRPALESYYASRFSSTDIRAAFAKLASWADARGVPRERILLGEFGVFGHSHGRGGPKPEDRARWIKDVREAAEAERISWAFYNYSSPFGILAAERPRAYDELVIDSLGLAPPR